MTVIEIESRKPQPPVLLPKQFCHDQRIGAAEIAVYYGLAYYVNTKTRKAWPSLATLAKDVKMSKRTVTIALKVLVDSGYLEAEPRPGKNTIYMLTTSGWTHAEYDPVVDKPMQRPQADPCRIRPTPMQNTSNPLVEPMQNVTSNVFKDSNKRISNVLSTCSSTSELSTDPLSSLSVVKPENPNQKKSDIQIKAEQLLNQFIKATGKSPKTSAEKANFLRACEQLAISNFSKEEVFCAAQRMAKMWTYNITPFFLAQNWSRFHKPVINGKHWTPGIGDHEPWMDLARKSFSEPGWEREVRRKYNESIKNGTGDWNKDRNLKLVREI